MFDSVAKIASRLRVHGSNTKGRSFMRWIIVALSVIAVCSVAAAAFAEEKTSPSKLFPAVEKYLDTRSQEFDQIPSERKALLKKIALYVKDRIKAGQPAKLTFICTHNSRRSQISQIWAAAAASHYGIAGVKTYSGGTEVTAFNPRAVAAMERAGLKVEKTDDSKNPHYTVRFQESKEPLVCFSKVYSDQPNPKEDFCAVMTCARADKNCPLVNGCSLRVAVPYEDPKVADGKPEEAAKYDERCVQISREMLYLFSQVGN